MRLKDIKHQKYKIFRRTEGYNEIKSVCIWKATGKQGKTKDKE